MPPGVRQESLQPLPNSGPYWGQLWGPPEREPGRLGARSQTAGWPTDLTRFSRDEISFSGSGPGLCRRRPRGLSPPASPVKLHAVWNIPLPKGGDEWVYWGSWHDQHWCCSSTKPHHDPCFRRLVKDHQHRRWSSRFILLLHPWCRQTWSEFSWNQLLPLHSLWHLEADISFKKLKSWHASSHEWWYCTFETLCWLYWLQAWMNLLEKGEKTLVLSVNEAAQYWRSCLLLLLCCGGYETCFPCGMIALQSSISPTACTGAPGSIPRRSWPSWAVFLFICSFCACFSLLLSAVAMLLQRRPLNRMWSNNKHHFPSKWELGDKKKKDH